MHDTRASLHGVLHVFDDAGTNSSPISYPVTRLMHFENNLLGITAGGSCELVFDYVPRGAIHEIALGRDGRSSLNDGYRARFLAFKSSKAASDAAAAEVRRLASMCSSSLHSANVTKSASIRWNWINTSETLENRQPWSPGMHDLRRSLRDFTRRLNLLPGAFRIPGCIFDLLKFSWTSRYSRFRTTCISTILSSRSVNLEDVSML